MASFQFACPHCSRPFELENPQAGAVVACPACGESLALPAQLPAALAPDDQGAEFAPPEVTNEESVPLAFDLGEPPPLRRGAAAPRKSPATPAGRQLSREERMRRQQVRSLVLMIGGVVVLAIAVIVLSRL